MVKKTGKRQAAGSTKVRQEVRQYCIDAVYFDEVLKAIPKKVDIISMYIRIGSPFGRLKLSVPEKSRKLGVLYRSIASPESREVIVKFEGMTRAKMIENLKTICKQEKLDYTYVVILVQKMVQL